jgi:ribosomal protein S18 acetylase RimI-like enzyme
MVDISFQCRPAKDQEREQVAKALKEHTERAIGMRISNEPFSLLAHDGEKLVGSVIGKIFFNWLHIDLFWVETEYRKKGIGTHLMNNTLEYATKAGLSGIEVWTQSWQAPGFYKKLGYEEFATLEDFTPGRKRHAFRKYISQTPA